MTFTIVQGDTSPSLSSTLTDGKSPVDISGYNSVEIHIENKYDEVIVTDDETGRVNVVNASSGQVEYVWEQGDTDSIGTYKAEWQVTYSDGSIETFPSDGKVTIEVTEETA
jgi:hypothetical protein